MIRFRKFIFFCLLPLLTQSSSCQQSSNQPAHSEGKLKIITTITPLYSFTKNITKDLADVENLLPSGVGPHDYSFSPLDVKKIAGAHVLIKNGVNLENWLDKLIVSAGKENVTIVDTSEGLEAINSNPHIWLSPGNAIIQVKNIMHALIEADAENGSAYRKNAEDYIRRLHDLDKEIEAEITTLKNKEFVSLHPAFAYFARDYGLKQAAVIYEYPGTEPSPKHIVSVIGIIRAKGIKTIFSEPLVSSKIVGTIAGDLNLQIHTIDPLETGTPYPGFYEDKMRENLSVFSEALAK